MPIKYDKLFQLLSERGYSSTYWLRQNGVHPRTVNKLKHGEAVTTETISALCALLDCQPGDIMEYDPDGDKRAHLVVDEASTPPVATDQFDGDTSDLSQYQQAAITASSLCGTWDSCSCLKYCGPGALEQMGQMLLIDKCSDEVFENVFHIITTEATYKRCTQDEAEQYISAGRGDGWKFGYNYWPEDIKQRKLEEQEREKRRERRKAKKQGESK
jgi:putative transcriptional regulator